MPNNDFDYNFHECCQILLKFCTAPREGQNKTSSIFFFPHFKDLIGRGTCSFSQNTRNPQNLAFEPR